MKGLRKKDQTESKQEAKIAAVVTLLSICALIVVVTLNQFGIISEIGKVIAIIIIAGLVSPLGVRFAVVCSRRLSKANKNSDTECDDRGQLPPKW